MNCLKVKIISQEQMRVHVGPMCDMGLGYVQLFCKDGALFSTIKGIAQKIFVKAK